MVYNLAFKGLITSMLLGNEIAGSKSSIS